MFVTVKFNSGESLKINLDKVEYIDIYNNKIDFMFQECYRGIEKNEALNFDEVKEIAENL